MGGMRSYPMWSPGDVETGGEEVVLEARSACVERTNATGRDIGGGGGYIEGE